MTPDYYLTKTEISSYVSNILPLQVKLQTEEGFADLSRADIQWSTEGDCFILRTFADKDSATDTDAFHDGVLLTLTTPGEGKVIAKIDGQALECSVHVRQRRTAGKDDLFKPYATDLHIHSTNNHDPETFLKRETGTPEELIQDIVTDKALDCAALTDHADLTLKRGFFQGFLAEESTEHDEVVMFPGAESELSVIEYDRFGLIRKNSGELVTFNSDHMVSDSPTWEGFYDKFKTSPFATAILNHPCELGWMHKCLWNFQLQKNARHPELKRLVKLVEMGNGELSGCRPLFAGTYSFALDCGLRVAPCLNSDFHGKYHSPIGKTFLLAPEKSREMFFDAIENRRVYACESGALNLKLTVNGCGMGETLPETNQYHFHVEASLLHRESDAKPFWCQVISDYGTEVFSADFNDSADFTITSDSARYFYIILTDLRNRRTWSAPVWTGRAFDDLSQYDNLVPMDDKSFTITDDLHGRDAGALIDGDPTNAWDACDTTASVTIDMKEIRTVSGIGHYGPTFYKADFLAPGFAPTLFLTHALAEFVSQYRILASCDGEHFTECRSGYIRNFGGEEVLPFQPVQARYVRFEALSTTGKDSGSLILSKKHVKIGELSIFTQS